MCTRLISIGTLYLPSKHHVHTWLCIPDVSGASPHGCFEYGLHRVAHFVCSLYLLQAGSTSGILVVSRRRMGNCQSITSVGSHLLAATASGNTQAARQLLERHPSASCYSTYVDRNSPLLVAAGRGHHRLVQAIVEAAVIAHGPVRAKERCINHTNHKGHSALMLACMYGHAQCVEALICNGASPLVLDNSRHNTALHWAASACRSACVQRLLGGSAMFTMQSGQVVRIADIPCFDEDGSTLVTFVDRHNGWGMVALHIAVFKGSTSTVRALLRNGATLSSVTVNPTVSSCPVRQAAGSNALHVAAANEDVAMVRLLLDAQISQASSDLRRAVNSQGQTPADVARAANNLLLLHILDPEQPAAMSAAHQGLLLYPGGMLAHTAGPVPQYGSYANASYVGMGDMYRSDSRGMLEVQPGLLQETDGRVVPAWMAVNNSVSLRRSTSARGSAGGTDQAPHVALALMLQRLRLVLSLEVVDLQSKLAAAAAANGSSSDKVQAAQQQQQQGLKAKQCSSSSGQGQKQASSVADAEHTNGNASDAEELIRAATEASLQPSASAASTPIAAVLSLGVSSSSVSFNSDALSSTTDDDDSDERADVNNNAENAYRCTQPSQQTKQQKHSLRKQALLNAEQHRRQRQAAAEVAALNNRLRTLQGLLAVIQDMLALLPASVTAATADSSSRAGGLSSTTVGAAAAERRGRQRRNSSGSDSSSSRNRAWSLLARVASYSERAVQRRGAASSTTATGDEAAAGASVRDAAAEQVLAAFVTPGMLSSLASATKLLVNSSALSGKKQQRGATYSSSATAGDGSTAVGTDTWLTGLRDQSDQLASAVADARWAEQEHALFLLRGVLQSASASLRASQQAMSAAASRIALRQRQQEQLDSLLSSNRHIAGLPGRQLALGSGLDRHHRVHFGPISDSRRDRDRAGSNSGRHHRDDGSARSIFRGLGNSFGLGTRNRAAVESAAAVASNNPNDVEGSSASWTAGMGLGLGFGLLPHPQYNTNAAAAAAAGSVLDNLSGGPMIRGETGFGLVGTSSGSSVRGSRRQQRSRQERPHRSRVGNSRRRGMMMHLPDSLGIHSGNTAAAVPDASRSSSASSSSRRSHRRHRHRRIEDADTLLFLSPFARGGVESAASTAATVPSIQQQQQPYSRTLPSANAAVSGAVTADGITLHRRQQQQQSVSSSPAGTSSSSRGTGSAGRQPASIAAAATAAAATVDVGDNSAVVVGSTESDNDAAEFLSANEDETNNQQGHVHNEIHSAGNSSCEDEVRGFNAKPSPSPAAPSTCSSLDASTCAICMDSRAVLSVDGCAHSLCLQCAYQLCYKAKGMPLCPFCRQPIGGFGASGVNATAM